MEKDNDNDNSGVKPDSSAEKLKSPEEPDDSLQERQGLVPRPSPIPIVPQNKLIQPNDNVLGGFHGGEPPVMDPVVAAMLQRQQQDEQKLLQTRLLLQQRHPTEDSILAAAMATASNNLMAAGNHYRPHAPQDPLMYQQLLLQGQGGIPPSAGSPFGAPPLSAFAHTSPRHALTSSGTKKKRKDRGPIDGASDYMASTKYKPYFDGSTLPDPGPDAYDSDVEKEDGRDDKVSLLPPKSKQSEAFPRKLYRIIEDAKENGQEDIISFFPHGRAFAIHKPDEFVSKIMPKYMSTARFSSFQRQLNLYRFKRITEGRDKGGYYHEFFLQGRKNLTKKIKRKRPSVPKATKEDLDAAARISNEILASGTYHNVPLDLVQQHQERLMMERGPLPQDVYGYGDGPMLPPANNLGILRGQGGAMYPPGGAPQALPPDSVGQPYGSPPPPYGL